MSPLAWLSGVLTVLSACCGFLWFWRRPAESRAPSTGVPGRLLGRFERYYVFTPLQRVFCVSAELSAQRPLPDVEALAAALLRVARQPGHGALAFHVAHSDSEAKARWSRPAHEAELRSLIARAVRRSPQETSLSAAFERELATDFDVGDSAAPLWRLLLMPRSHCLVLTLHHALTDAAGAVAVVQALLRELDRLDHVSADGRLSPVGAEMPPSIEELMLSPPSPSTVWRTLLRLFGGATAGAFTGPPAPSVPLGALTSRVLLRPLSLTQTLSVRSNARAHDVTVHGALVAATARALRRTWPSSAAPFSIRSTASLRPCVRPEHARCTGNCFTSFSDVLTAGKAGERGEPEDEAAACWAFASRYVAALKRSVLKEWRQQDAVLRLVSALGVAKTVRGDIARLHNLRNGTVELLNLGVVHTPTDCMLTVVQRTHNNAPLLLLGAVTAGEQLSLSLSYCSPLLTKEQATAFLDSVVLYMQE